MLLITNARIYTGFNGSPVVDAMLIHEDRIVAIGTHDELLAAAPVGTVQDDLQGKSVLPGLTDSHMHLEHYSLSLQSVNCETKTIEECLARVAIKAKNTPPGEWVSGWGWNQNVWEGGFGTAAQLDLAAGDHPVSLSAKSGHATWVNSTALQMAGIDASTPNPEGGVIQKDDHGQPTGILFENASDLVSNVIPEPSLSQLQSAVLEAQTNLWKFGITGLHDFDSLNLFSVLQILNQENLLKLRVIKGIPEHRLNHAVETGLRTGFGSAYLRIGSVKLFADGALGPQTAAMLEPFENSNEAFGILLQDVDHFFETGKKASQNGLSLAIHAIGDRANRVVLNAYEKLRSFERQNGIRSPRHRIEHVQLLDAADITRLSTLGIIASMQPIHATSDFHIANRFWGKRSQGAYAFRSLLDHHTTLTFGSDAPVETPNPFVGIHAAVTRRRADGTPGEDGWYPEQRITLKETLHAFTFTPAYAAGTENLAGTLNSGHYADLVVLDQDPFDLHPQELHLLKPSATMVGGSWVWRSA